jgi:glycosyltransferase involved in cell wall biosynthesis
VRTTGRPINTAPSKSPRQRILLVHDSHEFGGLEVVIIEFLRRLDPSFEVAVLVRGYEHTPWTSPRQLVDAIIELGIPVLRPTTPIDGNRFINRAREWGSTLRLIHRFKPDIVHIHTATVEGGRTQTMVARLAGARVVMRTEHNSPTAYSRKPFASWSRRLSDRLTSTVVTVSENDRHEQISVVGRRPEQVVCIHNGIDASRFAPRDRPVPAVSGIEPRGALVIGTTGRLSEQKGHRYLIAAAAELAAEGLDFQVVIAGDGELRDDLAKQVADLGIGDRVHLVGKIDDVPALLAGFDIAVMPSVHEGLSLALLEMMAMERATIVTDHPGLTEAAVDGVTSTVVPMRAPSAIATAIRALASDPERRRAYGVAGRQRVTSAFTHERYMRDVQDLYRSTRTRSTRRAG